MIKSANAIARQHRYYKDEVGTHDIQVVTTKERTAPLVTGYQVTPGASSGFRGLAGLTGSPNGPGIGAKNGFPAHYATLTIKAKSAAGILLVIERFSKSRARVPRTIIVPSPGGGAGIRPRLRLAQSYASFNPKLIHPALHLISPPTP